MFDKNSPFNNVMDSVSHGVVSPSVWVSQPDPYQELPQEAVLAVSPQTNKLAWLPVQSITVAAANGESFGSQYVQMSAVALDAHGNTIDVTALVTWATSDATIFVINEKGKVLQTNKCGDADISATLGAVTGSDTFSNGWC